MVSVIVPVYNAEKTIHNTVNSILNQTYTDIEVILVNDGSKDDSLKICYEIANYDTRVIVFDQENQGASVARNNGVSAANGEWIYFVDSDDFLPQDAIERLVNISDECADKNIQLIVGCNYPSTYDNTCDIYREVTNFELIKATLDPQKFYKYLKEIINVKEGGVALSPPWGKLISRNLIIDNDIKFPVNIVHHEDTIFCLRLFSCIKNALLTNANIYEYNHLENSVSVRFNKNRISDMKYAINIAESLYCSNLELNGAVEHFILRRLLDCFFGYITHKNNRISLSNIYSEIKSLLSIKCVINIFKRYKLSWYISNCGFKLRERVVLCLIKMRCTYISVLYCKIISFLKRF